MLNVATLSLIITILLGKMGLCNCIFWNRVKTQMNHDTPPSIFIKITKPKFIWIQEIGLVSDYLYCTYLYQNGQDRRFGSCAIPFQFHRQWIIPNDQGWDLWMCSIGWLRLFCFEWKMACFLYSRVFYQLLRIHGANGIFTYISHIYLHGWLICMGDVGKYAIHGSHGIWVYVFPSGSQATWCHEHRLVPDTSCAMVVSCSTYTGDKKKWGFHQVAGDIY